MRIFGIKMHNFMRFGEKGNSLIFDISKSQKDQIQNGILSFDSIYRDLSSSPVAYVESVNSSEFVNELEGIIGIVGMTSGSLDSSNGSGKSTIFEAISYLFYEKTVRQSINSDKKGPAGNLVVTRVDGLLPENLRESYVEAFFEEKGSLYRLKRGRSFTKSKKSSSPILEFECIKDGEIDSLSGHRKKDTKDSLDQVILDDFEIFVNTVMFGQNDAGKFLIGTDKIKKDMIIDILKLEDVVHGCIDVIREKKKKVSNDFNSSSAKIESYKSLLLGHGEKLLPEEKEYSSNYVNLLINAIGEKERGAESQTAIVSGEISRIKKEVNELESSESVKKAVSFGNEIKDLEFTKESEKKEATSRSSDFKKMIEDNVNSLSVVRSEIDLKKKRVNGLDDEIKSIEIKRENFNEEEYGLKIKKCEKAKLVEEEYKEKQVAIDKERERLLIEISESETRLKIMERESSSLSSQIEGLTEGETYICSECQSLVEKKHATEKISLIGKEISKKNDRIEKLKDNLSQVDIRRDAISKRVLKIEDWCRLHPTLLSEKKDHDSLSERELKVKKQIDEENREIAKKESQAKDLEKNVLEYKNKCSKIIEEFKERIDSINKQIESKKNSYKKIEEGAQKVKEAVDLLKKTISEKESYIQKISRFQGSINEKKSNVEKIKSDMDIESEKLETLRKDSIRYKILEDAFGLDGVQTRIVGKYLPLLNSYIKRFLEILSDGKLNIEMFVNSKMKVDMKIVGGTANSYIMLSGGEKMVVRLAVDIGLSLLAFSRSEKKPDMICLDEIFGPLDADHTKCVFKMFEELKDKFKKVFIISHKAEIQSAIKNNIVVEKDSGNRGLSSLTKIESLQSI